MAPSNRWRRVPLLILCILTGFSAVAFLSRNYSPKNRMGPSTPPSATSAPSALLATAQQDVPAALLATVAVHGWINKTGITNPRQWNSAYKTHREEAFTRWRTSPRTSGPQVAGPKIFCQIFYNAKYKFIYIRTPKVASSTLVSHFGLCSEAKIRPWCLSELSAGVSVAQAHLLWKESFVFGLTRSPFSRAISAYRFLAEKVTDGLGCTDGLTWDYFCSNPTSIADLCK
jgi:hypothetical protein